MTQQQKDELNKQLCGLLGICWHETGGVGVEENGRIYSQCRICKKIFRDREWGYNELGYESSNPDFTTEVGRVQLLKLMMKIKNYEDFGDLWFLFACWDDKENKVYAVPTKYLTDDNGAFARAARDFLKAMEGK